MIRRALGVAALVATLAACSQGPGTTAATTLPPTTRVPAPISPTGVVDTVRQWVAQLAADHDDQAWAVLGPRAQALIGSREDYRVARPELKKAWKPFATSSATYDGLPLGEGQALVIVHTPTKDGPERGAALPMFAEGTTWRAEPFLDTGRYRPVPADRTEVAPLPGLSVVVQAGTTVRAWVDGQPAEVATPKPTGIDELEYPYRPSTALAPGWHLVTYVFDRAGARAARTVRYSVAEPK